MARPKYPSDAIDKTMVRFPPGLMEKVKDAAAANNRSMNSEIVDRLEGSFEQGNAMTAIAMLADYLDWMSPAKEGETATANVLLRPLLDQSMPVKERSLAFVQVAGATIERVIATRVQAERALTHLLPGLLDRIKKAAGEHGRTVAEEITQALEEAYPTFDLGALITRVSVALKGDLSDQEVADLIENANAELEQYGEVWRIEKIADGSVSIVSVKDAK